MCPTVPTSFIPSVSAFEKLLKSQFSVTAVYPSGRRCVTQVTSVVSHKLAKFRIALAAAYRRAALMRAAASLPTATRCADGARPRRQADQSDTLRSPSSLHCMSPLMALSVPTCSLSGAKRTWAAASFRSSSPLSDPKPGHRPDRSPAAQIVTCRTALCYP